METSKSTVKIAPTPLETSSRNLDEKSSLSEQQSRPVEKSVAPAALPGPFDEGWLPWIQVLGSFAVWTNSWGLFNSFGEYQTYYQTSLLSHKSPDDIAWIGSLQAFLLLFMGTISGPLFDAGYFRIMIAGGGFLVVFGMMMTSLCSEYWQLILAQGIVVGIGYGFLFTPIVSLIPQWFQKRKALASGIAASGSGVGGIIYPIIFRSLQPKIGFRWATRVIAFVTLFLAIVASLTLRCKVNSASRVRAFYDLSAFSEVPYFLTCIGTFLTFIGIYAPWFYMGQYSLDRRITSESLAFYLVVLINAGSVLGRLGLSALADRFGIINIGFISIFCSSILALGWIGTGSTAGVVVISILYGAFAGSFLALAAILVLPLTKDLRTLGTRIGQMCFTSSFAALIGTPICGAILNSSHDFIGVQAFAGAVLMAGSIVVALAKTIKLGWEPFGKL